MRLIKKLLLFLFLLMLLAGSIGVGIAYVYQDELEQLTLQNINEQLQTPIQVDDIEFSLIRKFPYASLELQNLMVLDAFQKDTLLKVEKFFLKLNALDLYNENYALQQLELHNGFTRVSISKDGSPNYKIWQSKSDASQGISLELNQVLLNNLHIQYLDDKSKIHVSALAKQTELNGSIENGVFSAQINSHFDTDFVKVKQDMYVKNKTLASWVSIDASKNRTTFNGSVQTDDIELKYNGSVENGYVVHVSGTDLNINTGLNYVPKRFLAPIQSYQFNGIANLNVHIENQKNSRLPAAINADFTISNGSMITELPWKIRSANIQGLYYNGKHRNNSSSDVVLQSINCIINKETLNGSLTYSNFNNPRIQTQFKTELNLAEIQNWGYEIPIEELTGRMQITANYKGEIGLKSDITKDFEQAEKSASIQLNNTSFLYKPLATIQGLTGTFQLTNNRLEIDSLCGSIGTESKVNFVGAAENLFSQNQNLRVAGHLSSEWLKLTEIIVIDTTSNPSPFVMPNNITANITTNIKDAAYDKLHISYFQAKVNFNKGVLAANNIRLKSMSGDITGDITLSQTEDGRLRLITTSKLNQINVRQLFYEFQNFRQRTIRHKHLRGKTTSDIYLRAEWDAYLNPLPENLYAFLDVKINDGELINFEPLLLMSEYISVEDLKRIRFSTLENQIEVKNRSVEIPFMEIHSSAMDIAGSGTHFFDNTLDYEIEFSLNEMMSKRWRKNNKKQISEFGEIEKDGVKGTIIPLKMTGTVDDPKITFNFNRARHSIDKAIDKQKQEINDAFEQEFNKDSNSNIELEKTPDYNNIIEWEEDEHLF